MFREQTLALVCLVPVPLLQLAAGRTATLSKRSSAYRYPERHLVSECPRSYHLAYMLRARSLLQEPLNRSVHREPWTHGRRPPVHMTGRDRTGTATVLGTPKPEHFIWSVLLRFGWKLSN